MKINLKLARISASALLLVAAVVVERNCSLDVWQLLLVYLVPYVIVAYDVIGEAVEGLLEGEAFNEDFLMCVATIGALLIGFLPGASTEFPEAVFVMLFFQVGEMFEDYAEDKSRRSISHLMDIRPDVANVVRGGAVSVVSPDTVAVGETVIVKPGDKVPMDGVVLEGTSSLNAVALTGESVPLEVTVGDEVQSGCINESGLLKLRVTHTFGDSTASKIIRLVEEAGDNKSRSEAFITRFARVYTPAVVGVAVALAFIPPLLLGDFTSSFVVWLGRALTFLVVSCPCALVISVPLTFFGGIGGASRRGILIKGSNYMDSLAHLGTVVFDKTGTLTKGKFDVTAVHPEECDPKHLLHLAAHVERYSTHPIAVSLKAAYPDEDDDCTVDGIEEVAGKGVKAMVNGRQVCVGNSAMMDLLGVKWHPCHKTGTIAHVAIDGAYAGHIVISDTVKPDAQQAIEALKEAGVKRTVMLTGDRNDVAGDVAAQLGLDEFHAELLPADKLACEEALMQSRPAGTTLAFVGDGINDAPALARADVGIAMGAMGSDAAIESADVVLMDDKPSKVALAIAIARCTIAIAMQNVWFAIGVKLLVLGLAAMGLATMWMAVFADVGVTVLAVLNAMRALAVKD